jgi:hypothetical protein
MCAASYGRSTFLPTLLSKRRETARARTANDIANAGLEHGSSPEGEGVRADAGLFELDGEDMVGDGAFLAY